ncbi:MAG: IPT/TIG domain-containing protein [Streptococcus sp.]|nr:IPT/TIG domain-containing protein [Streptococcus sp.]
MSLNNVSWTSATKDTQYTPYGISQIYPNSGPQVGGTDITVIGSGFVNSGNAKC